MTEISDEIRWYALFRRRTELELKSIFDAYRSMSVEPVIIKGWAAARNYPESHPRFFGDIDIAVRSSDVEKCLARNRVERFTSLNIDLHGELRHLDTTPWDDLLERTELIEIEGTKVRVLSPEDHLRVLCTHWLTDGGQYKDRLWDIYYAVQNRTPYFDWSLALDNISATRRNWAITAIAIAKKHLGLNTADLPFDNELQKYPGWIDKCLAKEWASEVRLRSLDTCMDDRKLFWKQVRKRLPPNPIQATIETESMLDDSRVFPKQLKSISMRFRPSVKRLINEAGNRIWAKRSR